MEDIFHDTPKDIHYAGRKILKAPPVGRLLLQAAISPINAPNARSTISSRMGTWRCATLSGA